MGNDHHGHEPQETMRLEQSGSLFVRNVTETVTSRRTGGKTGMRHEKAENLLTLAVQMQSQRLGVSLAEIEATFGVGRRTAMRMKDAVMRAFPAAEEVQNDERIKRWRIPQGTLDKLADLSADEFAALEMAKRLLDRDNRESEAGIIGDLALKLRAVMHNKTLTRIDPDLEAMLLGEGLALRPGPRPRIGITVVEDLRNAIKAGLKVDIAYRNRRNRALNTRRVHPYGFLHGHRNYLVAFHENPKANKVALFSLPDIETVTLTTESFSVDPAFSLSDFASRSFGVFQEEPSKVELEFSRESADNAREWLFHPTQEMEGQPDGSLVVRFTAGGLIEMAWHLQVWGKHVKVLSPPELAKLVNGRRTDWGAMP